MHAGMPRHMEARDRHPSGVFLSHSLFSRQDLSLNLKLTYVLDSLSAGFRYLPISASASTGVRRLAPQCLAFLVVDPSLGFQSCMASNLLISHLYSPSLWNFHIYNMLLYFVPADPSVLCSPLCLAASPPRRSLALLSWYMNSIALSSPLSEDLFLSSHGHTHIITDTHTYLHLTLNLGSAVIETVVIVSLHLAYLT